MKSSEIKNINHALFLLKHFVELIAWLLPLLYDLEHKANLKSDEERNRNEIIDVYQNYSFRLAPIAFFFNSDLLLLTNRASKQSLTKMRMKEENSVIFYLIIIVYGINGRFQNQTGHLLNPQTKVHI